MTTPVQMIMDWFRETLKERQERQIYELVKQNAMAGGSDHGFVHRGFLFSLVTSTKETQRIYRDKYTLPDPVIAGAEDFLSTYENQKDLHNRIRQILGVVWIRCGRDTYLFLQNVPPQVAKVIDSDWITPNEADQYAIAKQSPLLWNQYKPLLDSMLFLTGMKLLS